MEKYFNPEGTYDKAIREKEVGVLRALLTGIVGSDPTFVTTEFEEAVKYIRNRSIDFNGEELILTEKLTSWNILIAGMQRNIRPMCMLSEKKAGKK